MADARPAARVTAFEIVTPQPETTENGGCLGRHKHLWECDGAVADGALARRRERDATRNKLAKMAVGVLVMMVVTVLVVVTTFLMVLENKPALRLEPNIGDGELVWYRSADDLGRVVAALSTFLREYDEQGDGEVKECAHAAPPLDGETCAFRTSWLGHSCQRENLWGYQVGRPCVLVTFDKALAAGWTPEVYTSLEELPEEMPEEMKLFISNAARDNLNQVPEMVWISCNTEDPEDAEYLGPVEYLPWRGFPTYYFPIRNTPEYRPPIVAVQFMKPSPRRQMRVRCRCWAKNLVFSGENHVGEVSLQLILD